MEQITLETVHKELIVLKQLMIAIQETMEDSFLTGEEERELDISIENYQKGKVKSLSEIEKTFN